MPNTPPSTELLVGVIDASLRFVHADRRLTRLLGDRVLEGRSLLEVVPEPSRAAAMLVATRVTREAVLATREPGVELVARGALVGDETWMLLVERPRRLQPSPSSPQRPFVGRRAELAELDRYLSDSDPSVLYVHGPLGIGKTALLEAFVARCAELGCPCLSIDAQAMAPTEDVIAQALACGGADGNRLERLVHAARALGPGRWVVVIDNFDAWQANADRTFVRPGSSLPSDCRIIVGARAKPDARWWESYARAPRMMPLGPLSNEEATELAAKLGVPQEAMGEAMRRAAGHPLCVVAQSTSIRTGAPLWSLAPALDVMDSTHWRTLEAAAVPARITEDVLSALLDDGDVTDAFDRLATIAVRDRARIGLRMPLVLREAIRNRLRERNPARLSELQRRLATYLGDLLDRGTASPLVPVADDFFDALDDHPVVRAVAGARDDALPSVRRATEADRAALAAAARRLGGDRSAEAIVRRFERGAEAVTCLAEGRERIEAICQYVAMTPASRAQGDLRDDTELAASLDLLRQRTVLEAHEHVIACLAWVGSDVRASSWGPPSQALFRHLFPLLLSAPKPAGTIFVLAEAGFPLGTRMLPGADAPVTIGGHVLVYRELRAMTASAMLAAIAQIEPGREPTPPAVGRPETHLSLETVREALVFLDEPERLVNSALLALRIVEREAGHAASPTEKAAALTRILRRVLVRIGVSHRDNKQHDVLRSVFLEKNGKHEKIAADLGIPYSTFRRHLTRGIERVAETLRVLEQNARRAASEQR